jgi:hypothetical protein
VVLVVEVAVILSNKFGQQTIGSPADRGTLFHFRRRPRQEKLAKTQALCNRESSSKNCTTLKTSERRRPHDYHIKNPKTPNINTMMMSEDSTVQYCTELVQYSSLCIPIVSHDVHTAQMVNNFSQFLGTCH